MVQRVRYDEERMSRRKRESLGKIENRSLKLSRSRKIVTGGSGAQSVKHPPRGND
jgi:hypothetical protein